MIYRSRRRQCQCTNTTDVRRQPTGLDLSLIHWTIQATWLTYLLTYSCQSLSLSGM